MGECIGASKGTSLPLVSIITPSYNTARFIRATIESVLQQNYPQIEHIVIDGNSTDGTLDILQEYEGQIQWVSEPDEGQSHALNKGFRMARGEIIGWLNADDTYNLGAVTAAASFLEAHPEVDMVYSDCYIIDEVGRRTGFLDLPKFDLGREVTGNIVAQPTVFIRRYVLEAVGYLNTKLNYVMDYELWLRIGRCFTIQHVGDTFANFRECEGTKTVSRPERFWPEVIQVLDRFFEESGLPDHVIRLRPLACARAHWMAGLVFHAMDQARLGQKHLEQALRYFDMTSADIDFAIDGLVDWALRPITRSHLDYAERVLSGVPLPARERTRFRQKTMAHLHISRAMQMYECNDLEGAWHDLVHGIRSDLTWLRNRGVWSIGIRSVLAQAFLSGRRRASSSEKAVDAKS